jgi:hypothetical protein
VIPFNKNPVLNLINRIAHPPAGNRFPNQLNIPDNREKIYPPEAERIRVNCIPGTGACHDYLQEVASRLEMRFDTFLKRPFSPGWNGKILLSQNLYDKLIDPFIFPPAIKIKPPFGGGFQMPLEGYIMFGSIES